MKRYIVRYHDFDADYDGECDYNYYATEEEAIEAGVHLEDEYNFVEVYDTEKGMVL